MSSLSVKYHPFKAIVTIYNRDKAFSFSINNGLF